MILTLRALRFTMQDTDFFSWLRTMLLRFQRMEAAEEVYHEIELQASASWSTITIRYVFATRYHSRDLKWLSTPITLSRGLVIIRQKIFSQLIRC